MEQTFVQCSRLEGIFHSLSGWSHSLAVVFSFHLFFISGRAKRGHLGDQEVKMRGSWSVDPLPTLTTPTSAWLCVELGLF